MTAVLLRPPSVSLQRTWARARRRAVTLFEVLIVIALIGMLTGSLVLGSGMLVSSRRRAAATFIMTASRLAQGRAAQQGKPHRLVFDLESSSISVEQATSKAVVREPEREEDKAEALEKAAQKEADRVLDGGQAARTGFEPVKELGFTTEEGKQSRHFDGVLIRSVHVAHEDAPRTSGKAYLYFYPTGEAEDAVVQLWTGGEDEGVTVRFSGLTGRSELVPGRAELPEAGADGEISERREE